MKTKRKWSRGLLIGIGATLALIYSIFLIPLPFVSSLWEQEVLRYRMAQGAQWRATGLHRDEVVQLLGESAQSTLCGSFVYPLRDPSHSHSWQHLIIFFDENDIATRAAAGKPVHFGIHIMIGD